MWVKDLLDVCGKELRKTVSDVGVLVFFIVVPLLYPLLYAYLYGREVVREVPVVAVDDCRSTTSREFLRKSDATPDLKIISYCSDMEEARNVVHNHKAYGIIQIPKEFDRTLAEGRQATINLYCDMSGLLYYKALLSGCTMVSLDMNRDIQMVRLGGMSDREKEVMTMPIENEYVTMFNPANGFQAFLIPAVLILVLQQTLVLGVAMMAGTENERRRRGELILGDEYSNPITVLGGKALAGLRIHRHIRAVRSSLVLPYASALAAAHPGGIHSSFPAGKHLLCHQYIILCKGQGIMLPAVRVRIGSAYIHERYLLANVKYAHVLEVPCTDIPLNTWCERICPHRYRRSIAAGCTL